MRPSYLYNSSPCIGNIYIETAPILQMALSKHYYNGLTYQFCYVVQMKCHLGTNIYEWVC